MPARAAIAAGLLALPGWQDLEEFRDLEADDPPKLDLRVASPSARAAQVSRLLAGVDLALRQATAVHDGYEVRYRQERAFWPFVATDAGGFELSSASIDSFLGFGGAHGRTQRPTRRAAINLAALAGVILAGAAISHFLTEGEGGTSPESDPGLYLGGSRAVQITGRESATQILVPAMTGPGVIRLPEDAEVELIVRCTSDTDTVRILVEP